MVKKTGEETGTEALDTGTEELETGTETQATPTAEEQLGTLQKDLERVTADLEAKDKGLRTAHQTLTEKDKELKKRAEIDTRLEGFEETQKILAAMLNERITSSEGLEPSEKKDYLSQFDEITKRQKAERDAAQARSQQEEYGTQARATYTKAKEVYPDDDVKLLRIERFLDQGMLDDAEALIAKAEGKATDTKETKMESEEDKKTKWIEEGKRLAKEASGELTTDNSSPSGAIGGLTIEQLEKMSPEEKRARRDEIAKLPLIIED